tara:strand:- start:1393 stop:2523 length:1131 start_codon:yes stop_codon:yes gene_type:complete
MKDDSLIKLESIKLVKGRKKHLICCSLFKMKNSYKDFSVYTEGLLELLKFFDNINKDIVLRIYFDESLDEEKSWINIMEEIRERNYTELLKYECKKLKEGKFHDGVFGTLIRFLPLFDNEKEKDWELYSSIDVDFENFFLKEIIKTTDYFEQSKQKFFIKLPKCYHKKPWIIKSQITEKYSLVVLGGAFSSKITFNKNLLLNFLLDIMKKGKIFKKFVNNYRSLGKTFEGNLTKDLFLYGIDEYFLTDTLLKNLNKRNINILLYNWFISYAGLILQIRKLNNNFKDLNQEEKERWKRLLKKVINYKNNKSLKQNYIFLELNSHCQKTKFNRKLCMKFGKEMRNIFNQNKQNLYNIPDDFEECFKHRDYKTYQIIKL